MRGTLQPVASPDFKAAARRHHDDAHFLLGDNRWANADHLAGLAAECALKAIIQRAPFGAPTNPKGIPVWGQPSRTLAFHINKLWQELAQSLSGHSATAFAALLAGPPPFATWEVEDRYSDGLAITQPQATAHAGAARQVLAVLLQADSDGFVS